ncbi:hypothetical protein SCMU_39350 [Sinomonas cyclohexanicum]|uniref:Uracil DNA glycosylase superfamily protein n=1 Tax=Sinomonas cyclohexanicum TaxID=322009 RepID=A0ABM7Q0J8_SINCY|nr:hypothetical protein [Corynebacterium cyclohexanicum]BCT78093.1 hypothetical protein SCMU_39350 [Corynebacterium cyclohexanicum]
MTSLLDKMAPWELTASWAVWPRSERYSRTSDISFPSGDLAGVLHARSIVLGLNPGESAVERTPWQNFHTGPRHNDHFLAEAFRDTPHWGAYMTDLLTQVNSKSKTLDLSEEIIVRDVGVLAEQLLVLEVDDPIFILIGARTAWAFKQHQSALAEALGLATVRSAKVPHYSAANGRMHRNRPDEYRRIVLSALDGAADCGRRDPSRS